MRFLVYSTRSVYTGRKVGGAENSLLLLAQTLASRGHEVTFVTVSATRVWQPAVEERDGLRVVYLPSFRNLSYPPVPLAVSARIDRLSARMSTLESVLRLETIDIVYLFYQLDAIDYFLSRRDNAQFRIVMRMAGLDWVEACRRSPRSRARYQRAFSLVDGINYPSDGLRQLTHERAPEVGLNLAPQAEFTADIGVRLQAGHRQWRGSGSSQFLQAVTATRFSATQKRQDLLVAALSQLRDQGSITPHTFHLRLIGDGEKREQIASRVAELSLGQICSVEPFMSQEQLWNILESADLLCHPCDYEGLSKIVAEAMAMGLPVLASDVTPMNEQIRDGVTGFLCENTVEAWATRLEDLTLHPERLGKISENERRFASEQYDPMNNVDVYIREFSRIAGSSAHTQRGSK